MSESVPDAAFEPGAEQIAVAPTTDRQLETDGCPECDQPPADEFETFTKLFEAYSPAGEGLAQCRNCQTVFDVESGEVVSA